MACSIGKVSAAARSRASTKGKGFALCLRCDKAYDLTYGTQIENYALGHIMGGMFAPRLSVTDGDDAQLLYVRTTE